MRISRTTVAMAQGLVFTACGLWPVVHLRSFERASGPKLDGWLVKTVGLLLASIGGGLLVAARKRRVTNELALVAATSAASLLAIDLRYGLSGRIPRRYLGDAVLQGSLLLGWGWATAGERRAAAATHGTAEYTGMPAKPGGGKLTERERFADHD